MQKDVIYIDVEDDITAIIGKVKAANHKIVALVPPKRVGVLQSAVNLRLVNRAATQKDKRLVLITNNSALASLAAAAAIPVAKTLQSKPELAPIDALEVDDGEDIIDGSSLPVGEHAKQSPNSLSDDDTSVLATASLAAANIDKAAPPVDGEQPKPKVKRGSVVPNFNTFRKKLALAIAAVVLLVGFGVWAMVFAPKAKVAVLMRTTDSAVSQPVNLVSGTRTSVSSNLIEATTQTITSNVSVDFEATGEKNAGERAKGTVKFSHGTPSSRTIPAGTVMTANGLEFELSAAVTVPAATLSFSCGGICPGEAEGSVVAAEPGADYNGANGSMSGAPSGVSASLVGPTSGGTDRTVKVATQANIDKARDKALAAIDKQAAVSELRAKFGDGFIVLDDSIQIDNSELKSSVEVGAEATNGKATYGGKVTFVLYGVAKSELEAYLKSVIEKQIDNPERMRVYDSGADSVVFTNVDRADTGVRATLSTNGKIGPTIDEDEVKEIAAGKRIGDIQSALEKINGIRSVDVELSPFWVTRAPSNIDKIMVEFQLDE